MNALFKFTILAEVQKENYMFQHQINITLSYYLNFNQTKKITTMKMSIMYNQRVLRNKSKHYQKRTI